MMIFFSYRIQVSHVFSNTIPRFKLVNVPHAIHYSHVVGNNIFYYLLCHRYVYSLLYCPPHQGKQQGRTTIQHRKFPHCNIRGILSARYGITFSIILVLSITLNFMRRDTTIIEECVQCQFKPFFSGTNYDPQWTSTKIIFIVIFFTGLVVYTAYSASLTSALAVVEIKYPFTDLKTFYHDTDYKIGSVTNTAMDELFRVRKCTHKNQRTNIIFVVKLEHYI